jgi:hypothetical protein
MTIKDLSESLGISQSKIKKIALDLLGCIPAELSGEDESKIRMAIASTTQALAAATEATNEMVKASPQQLSESHARVSEILGESVIKRLVGEYLAELQAEFKAQKFQLDTLQFEIEQKFYSQLSGYQQTTQNESLARIRKNSNYFSLESLQSLPEASSDDDLLEQIASFMEVFDCEQR